VFDATVAEGALGWDVELFAADGVTPLADTDSDGVPDTGRLGSGSPPGSWYTSWFLLASI